MNFKNYKKQLLISGPLVVLIFAAAYIFLVSDNFEYKQKNQTNTAYNYLEKIEGFSEKTAVKLEYTDGTALHTEEINISSTNPTYVQNQNTITSSSEIYGVYYTIENSNHEFIDIDLSIDKSTNSIAVKFLGLPTNSDVGVIIHDAYYLQKTPVDWAGNLIFNTKTSQKITDSSVCFEISNLKIPSQSSICHYVSGNVERQVQS